MLVMPKGVDAVPVYSPQRSDNFSMPPSSYMQLWLEEVRAQREFINARRRAKREANEERLRAIDPWVANRVREANQQADWYRNMANARYHELESDHQQQIKLLERGAADSYYTPYPDFYPFPYPLPPH